MPDRPSPLREADGCSLLLIVPAWKRADLAAICYRQHADLRARARRLYGLDLDVLVIANDRNLEAAAAAGLLTLEYENLLGAKLNLGYQYAAREGFDYVCPIGSDSWMLPERVGQLPRQGTVLCTRNYTCVDAAGRRQGWFQIGYDGGVGSRIFPTGMLKACGYRPLRDRQMHGCDSQTWRSVTSSRARPPRLAYTNLHPSEVVGFQSDTQITSFDRLADRFLVEWQPPLTGLDRYPARLVDEIRAYYTRPDPGRRRMSQLNLFTVPHRVRLVHNEVVVVLKPGQRIPLERAIELGIAPTPPPATLPAGTPPRPSSRKPRRSTKTKA